MYTYEELRNIAFNDYNRFKDELAKGTDFNVFDKNGNRLINELIAAERYNAALHIYKSSPEFVPYDLIPNIVQSVQNAFKVKDYSYKYNIMLNMAHQASIDLPEEFQEFIDDPRDYMSEDSTYPDPEKRARAQEILPKIEEYIPQIVEFYIIESIIADVKSILKEANLDESYTKKITDIVTDLYKDQSAESVSRFQKEIKNIINDKTVSLVNIVQDPFYATAKLNSNILRELDRDFHTEGAIINNIPFVIPKDIRLFRGMNGNFNEKDFEAWSKFGHEAFSAEKGGQILQFASREHYNIIHDRAISRWELNGVYNSVNPALSWDFAALWGGVGKQILFEYFPSANTGSLCGWNVHEYELITNQLEANNLVAIYSMEHNQISSIWENPYFINLKTGIKPTFAIGDTKNIVDSNHYVAKYQALNCPFPHYMTYQGFLYDYTKEKIIDKRANFKEIDENKQFDNMIIKNIKGKIFSLVSKKYTNPDFTQSEQLWVDLEAAMINHDIQNVVDLSNKIKNTSPHLFQKILLIATKNNYQEIISYFLDNKLLDDNLINSIMRYAIDDNNQEMILYFINNNYKLLLTKLADSDIHHILGKSIDNKNQEIISYFLENQLLNKLEGNDAVSIIEKSIDNNNQEIISYFLENKLLDKLENNDAASIMEKAIDNNNQEIISYFLESKLLDKLRNNDAMSVIRKALDHNNQEIILYFFIDNKLLYMLNMYNITRIIGMIIHTNNKEVISYILENKLLDQLDDPDIMSTALYNNNQEIISYFLENKLLDRLDSSDIQIVLSRAIYNNNQEIISYILGNKLLNKLGPKVDYIMAISIDYDHKEIISYILGNKLLLKPSDDYAIYIINEAIKHNNQEIISYFLENKLLEMIMDRAIRIHNYDMIFHFIEKLGLEKIGVSLTVYHKQEILEYTLSIGHVQHLSNILEYGDFSPNILRISMEKNPKMIETFNDYFKNHPDKIISEVIDQPARVTVQPASLADNLLLGATLWQAGKNISNYVSDIYNSYGSKKLSNEESVDYCKLIGKEINNLIDKTNNLLDKTNLSNREELLDIWYGLSDSYGKLENISKKKDFQISQYTTNKLRSLVDQYSEDLKKYNNQEIDIEEIDIDQSRRNISTKENSLNNFSSSLERNQTPRDLLNANKIHKPTL